MTSFGDSSRIFGHLDYNAPCSLHLNVQCTQHLLEADIPCMSVIFVGFERGLDSVN